MSDNLSNILNSYIAPQGQKNSLEVVFTEILQNEQKNSFMDGVSPKDTVGRTVSQIASNFMSMENDLRQMDQNIMSSMFGQTTNSRQSNVTYFENQRSKSNQSYSDNLMHTAGGQKDIKTTSFSMKNASLNEGLKDSLEFNQALRNMSKKESANSMQTLKQLVDFGTSYSKISSMTNIAISMFQAANGIWSKLSSSG